jgi:hypothetical protein
MRTASQELVPETLVYEHDVLGTLVYSRLPQGYQGPTQVDLEGAHSRTVLCFPEVRDARLAAKFGVGELGGYRSAVLSPASAECVTHSKWSDWAFDVETEPLH